MLPCIEAPGGTGGEQQRVVLESGILLSTPSSCPPVSDSPPSTSSAGLPQDISSAPQSNGKCTTAVTSDSGPSDWELPSCTRESFRSLRLEENDGKTTTSPVPKDNDVVRENRSITASHGSVVHSGDYKMDNKDVLLNYSTTGKGDVQMEHNVNKDAAIFKAQVRGEAGCGERNELLDFSPPGRRADVGCWRDGLPFFCSRENYSAGTADNSSTTPINGAENEETVQPRNFFPFNSIFAVAGWGSGAGWFFSSGDTFAPAPDDSPAVGAEAAGDGTAEQGPAGVYLPRFSTVPRSRKVLPPLISIGKRAAPHKSSSAEQGSLEQLGATIGSPGAKELLASPWHPQEGRHSAQARMNLRRKRVEMSPRSLVSSQNAGLSRNRVTASRPSPERNANSSSRSSISMLKSVGDVLWNCFCKLLRSRFNSISTSAAAAAASKAAKRIRRVPGVSQLFRDDVIELALQDFSVGEVVRQWLSSLLYISGKRAHKKSVFLGPVRSSRSPREASERAEAPKDRFAAQNGVAFPGPRLSTTNTTCDNSAHVFITPEAGRLLWRSACSLIANPVTAMYFQCYRLASLGTIVYVTSVVHWWQPQLGARRTLDVLTVCVVSGIHIIVACVNVAPLVLLVYLLLCCAGVACYLVGCSLAFQGFHQEAAICHIGLHSLCTIGNVLLYYTISL